MKKISQEKISTHIQEVPQEKIEQWKSLYEKYKSILKVNSKSVLEIIEFLKRKYVIVEETSEEFKHVVINNIKLNKPFSQKISSDKELKPIVFTIPNEGNAKKLYDTQEETYSGTLLKLLETTVDLGTSEHPQSTRGAPAACPASPCPTRGPAAPGCIKWRRRRRRRVAPWARAVPSMPGG